VGTEVSGARRDVRAQLDRHGLAPARRRGQNFLVDPEWAARIVSYADLRPQDAAIEIGPGLGMLTRALAARARRVVAIEIDAGLARALRGAELPAHVELRHADALDVDLHALARELGPRVHVVANLPYAVSSPLLRWLLGARDGLLGWVVMVQKEVAKRLLATPGTRDYGSLAALHQIATHVERMAELGGAHFYPVPRVSSVVVRITPLRPGPLRPAELEPFEAFLRTAFSVRRKTLANALRTRGSRERVAEVLRERGFDTRVRAEQIPPRELLQLFRSLGEFSSTHFA
jgi:16S rRNA (adenine1518-N6/adenine1519-N6)-dimethyltransferase